MNVQASSCRLDDLALALALFILQQDSLRRDLSGKLNEPGFCRMLPKEKALIAYNITKWKELAEECLTYNLKGDGVHLILPMRIILGLHIRNWPISEVVRCKGNMVVIKDATGPATD